MAKNEARYKEALRKGFEHNANEEWQKALGAFRAAINEFPQKPVPYVGLGEACFGLKQLDKALECYKLAARYSGGDLSYLQKVADIQERLGQLSEASRTYAAAGEVLLRERKLDEAIGNWERAVRLDANLLGAHQRLATVFQRLNNTTKAVREYLAIARILEMRGESDKALRMCQAALRLDQGNENALTAIELIKHGADSFEDEPEPVAAPAARKSSETLGDAIRQMANILETEARERQETESAPADDPVEQAHRMAQEQLAEEIFRDDEDEDEGAGLTKLERDAMIGQAMDFERSGRLDEAVKCYEQVIAGGLRLPGAFFALGYLLAQQKETKKARQVLSIAARHSDFKPASQMLVKRLG